MSKDYIKKIVDDVDNAELGTEASVSNWASTGSYAINKIISNSFVRGLPFNRVVEIFGDPSTGKSLLIYHLIANVQKMGGVAILDDTEDAYTPEFGKMIGINNQELIRLSSLTVEEHFEKVLKVVRGLNKEDDKTSYYAIQLKNAIKRWLKYDIRKFRKYLVEELDNE